ncbi:MAG: guanylate kinase [Bacteroidales bacterium]
MINNGKAIIVSAPSGAGKTTIVKHLLESGLGLEFSVSACSRSKREGETEGKDYFFLTPEVFKQKIDAGEFVEWQEVYPGSYYGTLHSELQRIWNSGHHVIFDVDVFGGINLKKIFADKALSVFIAPPSVNVLEERLRKRGMDQEESILKRLDKAQLELEQQIHFDKVVINDGLQKAKEETVHIIKSFLSSTLL